MTIAEMTAGARGAHLEALVFDKDGTLFHFAGTWELWAESFLTRLAAGDRARAAHLGALIGFDLPSRTFAAGSIVVAETPFDIATALIPHLPGMQHGALLDLLNAEAEIVPQAEAVPLRPYLEGLRARGLRLGVATNDAEVPALAHLRGAGIEAQFDFIAGSDSGHGAKPAPGQLLAFASAVEIAPERIAMVGDSTHDLEAGRAAGMATIGVLTGLAEAAELAPVADVVLPDIGHIPAWLGH